MNELDRQLREAGQAPVPPPDPAFATMLEDRLRAGVLASEPALRPARRPAAHRWFPVAALAAAAVVLGAVVAVRGGQGETVRVASATDTVVVLPDGTVGPATPGLEIPDGSRLLTGNDGHVVAGKTELGPKQEATVRRGTLKLSPTTVPPTATTRPPVKPETPSTRPAPTPTTKPPAIVTPTTTKPTVRPSDTKATTTSTSGPTGTVAALKLDARYRDTTAKLQWSPFSGPNFAAYLVLRSDSPAEPRYPVDDATTVVARITDPRATSFIEAIAEPAGRVYRVVAVDSERRLLASSPAATPQPVA